MTIRIRSASTTAFEDARVSDAMHAGVLTCPPSTSLRTIARMMAQYGIHAVVVTHPDDEGDGEVAWRVVSDLALARHAAELDDTSAGGAATEALVTVHLGDPLARAALLMAEHDVNHLVVVDDPERPPVGIVSTLDLARAFASGRV